MPDEESVVGKHEYPYSVDTPGFIVTTQRSDTGLNMYIMYCTGFTLKKSVISSADDIEYHNIQSIAGFAIAKGTSTQDAFTLAIMQAKDPYEISQDSGYAIETRLIAKRELLLDYIKEHMELFGVAKPQVGEFIGDVKKILRKFFRSQN